MRNSAPVGVSDAVKTFAVCLASDPEDPTDPLSERRSVFRAEVTPEEATDPDIDLASRLVTPTLPITDPDRDRIIDRLIAPLLPIEPERKIMIVCVVKAMPLAESVPVSDLNTFRTIVPPLVKLADRLLLATLESDPLSAMVPTSNLDNLRTAAPTGKTAPASERLDSLETAPVVVAVPATTLIGSRASAPTDPIVPPATLTD